MHPTASSREMAFHYRRAVAEGSSIISKQCLHEVVVSHEMRDLVALTVRVSARRRTSWGFRDGLREYNRKGNSSAKEMPKFWMQPGLGLAQVHDRWLMSGYNSTPFEGP